MRELILRLLALAGIVLAGVGARGASASSEPPRVSPSDVCRTLERAAADTGLPVEFFVRLIWQESRFDPGAVSSKGAMGIAQFMPRTASGRGLANPFDAPRALRESANYLRELRVTFGGNLGLAAAAYNAGPGRIEGWMAGRRTLPEETRAYVRIVTGYAIEDWTSARPPQIPLADAPKDLDCVELAKLTAARPRPPPAGTGKAGNPAWGPWGVQLAGNWSEGAVLASYERLRRTYGSVLRDRLPLVLRAALRGPRGATRYFLRVSESTRAGADALCARLRAASGACIVLRNPADTAVARSGAPPARQR